MTRRTTLVGLGGVAAIAVLAVGAGLFRGPSVRVDADRPFRPGQTSVVVLIGCTLRADQTTPYGGPGTTPFLDALAAEGTRFDETIANAPWTKAGSTALWTGQHAISLAVNLPGRGHDDQRLPDEAVTLAERFRAAGYATVGATANPNTNGVFGFDQGFDAYHEATGLWRHGEVKVPGRQVVDEWLRDVPRDRPFYGQVMLTDAHFPYNAGWAWWAWRLGAPTPRIAQYRAMLSRLDDAFQYAHDALAARGQADDTVFVVIADHGEGLYSPRHHGKSHGFYLYPSAVHVPWLVAGPGVARGHVVTGLTQQVDLAPTLTALIGAPPVPGDVGEDRTAALRGDTSRSETAQVYVDTWFRDADRAAVYTPDRMCQRDYADPTPVRSRPSDEEYPDFATACFDRAADPDMTQPIDDPGLAGELDAWRAARLDERRAFVAQHGEPRSRPDADLHKALEGLGYIE